MGDENLPWRPWKELLNYRCSSEPPKQNPINPMNSQSPQDHPLWPGGSLEPPPFKISSISEHLWSVFLKTTKLNNANSWHFFGIFATLGSLRE